MKKNKSLIKNEKGATAIEYGLIIALVALSIVGALSGVSTGVQNTFSKADSELTIAP